MEWKTSWNNAEPLSERNGWADYLGLWYGLNIRVNRGLKPLLGVGKSGAEHRLPERIISHMWVDKNVPWMGPHLRRKLVTIFVSGIKRESSKQGDMDVLTYRLLLAQRIS